MADIWRGASVYTYRPFDRTVAVNSQAWMGAGLTASQVLSPPGRQSFPERVVYRRDWQTAQFLLVARVPPVTPVPLPTTLSAQYFPDRLAPLSKQAAMLSQPIPNTQVPLGPPPAPPPGGGGGTHGGGGGGGNGGNHGKHVQAIKSANWVAATAQQQLHWFGALELGAVPSVTAPPGVQYYPVRIDRASAMVAVNSQRFLFWFPLSQTAIAFWGGSGSFTATASGSSGLAPASFTGSGAFNAVGVAVTKGVATLSGSGGFTVASASAAPAVASWTGGASFNGVAAPISRSTAVWSGAGAFNSIQATTLAAVETWNGAGGFSARGGFSNHLPFNDPPSWSITINGSIIYGCGYDVNTGNLKIWFTGYPGQFIILGPFSIGITQQIQFAADPQGFVLALIKRSSS